MESPVDLRYLHAGKEAHFISTYEIHGVHLKVYEIAAEGQAPSPDTMETVERWSTHRLSSLARSGDCGFVILHRCGADFCFLLLGLWRGNNELWEAVWYREGKMSSFEPFKPAYPRDSGTLRPTFCVWELGVVTHEARSWSNYLETARDTSALLVWQTDTWSGKVR